MRDVAKRLVARAASALPQARPERALFVIAHMRCGSTALSNVLCSRPEISGYGECHVAYGKPAAMGGLIVNQARRGAWKPRAQFLFDKVLHTRHDAGVDGAFFRSHAIFLVRRPAASIASTTDLFVKLGRRENDTHAKAALYYAERLERMAALWSAYAPANRIAITHDDLLDDPDAVLARVSRWLDLRPPLENRYVSHRASRSRGGGDPLRSGSHDRIERRQSPSPAPVIEIDDALRERVEAAYATFVELARTDAPTRPHAASAA